MTWKAQAEPSIYYGGAALRMIKLTEGKISEITNLTLSDRREGEFTHEPPFMNGPDAVGFMQAVMDAGYEYGLRPSKATDSQATEKHLEDMREITRHLLKMNAT